MSTRNKARSICRATRVCTGHPIATRSFGPALRRGRAGKASPTQAANNRNASLKGTAPQAASATAAADQGESVSGSIRLIKTRMTRPRLRRETQQQRPATPAAAGPETRDVLCRPQAQRSARRRSKADRDPRRSCRRQANLRNGQGTSSYGV